MATRKDRDNTAGVNSAASSAASSVEELLLAALESGGDSLETGRYLVTFKEGAVEEGLQSLGAQGHGMRVADARDFEDQVLRIEDVGDADAVVLPEIGVALVGGEAAQSRNMSTFAEVASDSPVISIDPEYFVFPSGYGEYLYQGEFLQEAERNPKDSLRSVARILELIADEIYGAGQPQLRSEEEATVLGAT